MVGRSPEWRGRGRARRARGFRFHPPHDEPAGLRRAAGGRRRRRPRRGVAFDPQRPPAPAGPAPPRARLLLASTARDCRQPHDGRPARRARHRASGRAPLERRRFRTVRGAPVGQPAESRGPLTRPACPCQSLPSAAVRAADDAWRLMLPCRTFVAAGACRWLETEDGDPGHRRAERGRAVRARGGGAGGRPERRSRARPPHPEVEAPRPVRHLARPGELRAALGRRRRGDLPGLGRQARGQGPGPVPGDFGAGARQGGLSADVLPPHRQARRHRPLPALARGARREGRGGRAHRRRAGGGAPRGRRGPPRGRAVRRHGALLAGVPAAPTGASERGRGVGAVSPRGRGGSRRGRPPAPDLRGQFVQAGEPGAGVPEGLPARARGGVAMKGPGSFGGGRGDRIAALRNLVTQLHTPGAKAADVLAPAGDLLRRGAAAGVDPGEVDAALKALTPSGVHEYLASFSLDEVGAQLGRAAEEALEAGLSETPDEQEMWAASALEALGARDRAESVSVAAKRWADAAGGGEEISRFSQRLAELDRRLKGKARSLTPLNGRRRAELELLDEAHRQRAWWFGARSECDGLLGMLSGQVPAGGAHLDGCPECRRDLERAKGVDAPAPLHLSSEDAWRLELGQMPAAERAKFHEHAQACLDCAQILWAMQEGDKAIAEEEGDAPRPFVPAARGAPGAAARMRGHREIARRDAYRVVLVKSERVRVLVQPTRGGLALAMMALPPQRNVYEPRQTSQGLEFDLGAAQDVEGRTARLTVRVTLGGENEVLEIPL